MRASLGLSCLDRRLLVKSVNAGDCRYRKDGTKRFSGYKNTCIAARHVEYEPNHFHSSEKWDAFNRRLSVGFTLAVHSTSWTVSIACATRVVGRPAFLISM